MATFSNLFEYLLILQLFSSNLLVYGEYYSLNGSNNNMQHPDWGSTNRIYRRLSNEHNKLSYSDGFHGINPDLPNVRVISNAIGQIPKAQSKYDKYSPLSGISWIYSKTLSQELCKTETNETNFSFYPIKVPPCDWYWDYNCTNQIMMPFWRAPYQNTTDNVNGKTYPTPINHATAFMDLHYIYGRTTKEQQKVRLFKDGLIKTPVLYAFNTSDELIDAQLDHTGHIVVDTANHSINTFYEESNRTDRSFGGIMSGISGYTTTECPFMQGAATSRSLITYLWKLNHNRIARELAEETGSSNDEYLFQEARIRQIATSQHITYTEYLPLFLAGKPIINNLTYNASVDPTVSVWFCSLAHRYSHPAMPNRMPFGGYHDNESQPIYGEYINETISSVSIRDAVTYPCMGIDSIKNNHQNGNNVYFESMLGGLMLESENLITPKHNEFLRSFLQHIWYQPQIPELPLPQGMHSTRGQIDLFASDILRARDYGMPSYNDARELFGLSRVEKWEDLTDNEWYLEILPTLYDDITDLDAYVGGLLEKVEADYPETRNGSGHIGPLFAAILRDQYYRAAAGDRLFYIYNETLRNYTSGITLSKIIEWNTNLKNLSTDIFTADSKNVHNQQLSEQKSVSLFGGALYIEWEMNDDDNTIQFTFRLECGGCDIGWIGIGFGEGAYMKGKDIIKMNFNRLNEVEKQFIVMDAYCPENQWIPLPDPDENGQDATLIDGTFNDEDGTVTIIMQRAMNQHNADGFFLHDYPIKRGQHCCTIIAYNIGSDVAKHDTDHRTPIIIDYYSGDSTIKPVDVAANVKLRHGLLMIFLFGLCYPVSAFIARYLKHYKWARAYHKISAKLGLTTALTSAYFAISAVVDNMGTTHSYLGVSCLVFLCCQAGIGYVISYWLDNYKRSMYFEKIKYCHLFIAICILILAPICMWQGWIAHGDYQYPALVDGYAFVLWYIVIILLLIIGESYTRLWPKFASKRENFFEFNIHNYHIYKWAEIGEKVSAGAAWIIINNYVYDVTEWQYSHPGGRRILLHYFGTDCTKFFNGTEYVGDAHGNVKHQHSDYAKKQMINMIVGEVYSEKNKRRDIMKRRDTAKDRLLFDVAGDVQQQIFDDENINKSSLSTNTELERYNDPRKLTVTTLINKQIVSGLKHSKRKIVLFEFDYNVILQKIQFDGDYILLHDIDKNTVTRAYTPINPKFILCNNHKYYDTSYHAENTLFLMIRLYKKGRMSQILNKLEIGHTIRITGPFRREQLNPSIRGDNIFNIIPNKQWIDNWLFKLLDNPTFQEKQVAKQQLQELQHQDIDINDENNNNYWRRIVLICGGTGITPMFNVIQHHLDNEENDDIRVNLIWCNRTLNDVTMEEQLKYYKLKNEKRFWIDLKFDIIKINQDLEINKERSKYARLHGNKWYKLDMIRMIKDFFVNGIPTNFDRSESVIKQPIKSPINKNKKIYTSVDIYDDDENEEKEEKEMQIIPPQTVSSDGYIYDSEHDLLNKLTETLSVTDNDDEKHIESTKKRNKNNDIIILSGPRPFVEKQRNAIYAKAKDLNKYINLKKQFICLD